MDYSQLQIKNSTLKPGQKHSTFNSLVNEKHRGFISYLKNGGFHSDYRRKKKNHSQDLG